MANAYFHTFDDRGVIRLDGEDRAAFLQGLVSNDVLKVSPERAGYGAFLTAQGKFLHDFFLVETGDALLIETAADRLDDFFRKLRMYKLRSKVELTVESDGWVVAAVFGADAFDIIGLPPERGAASAFAEGLAFVDPRHADAGLRVLLPEVTGAAALAAAGLTETNRSAYDRRRVSLGLPDGSRDLAVEKTVLLEAGFEELGGVDFQKGCYMGQELTARTKYRGLVKRRLMPIVINGPLPASGTEITLDGREAGEVRSVVANTGAGEEGGGLGLAMIRLNRLDEAMRSGAPLTAGESTVIPHKPDWATF
ncbi:MAG: folate-binding protein [Thalassobaculaceae bacterium]|nr:folate-binding protein [Thalassobaculaceae bacterium]